MNLEIWVICCNISVVFNIRSKQGEAASRLSVSSVLDHVVQALLRPELLLESYFITGKEEKWRGFDSELLPKPLWLSAHINSFIWLFFNVLHLTHTIMRKTIQPTSHTQPPLWQSAEALMGIMIWLGGECEAPVLNSLFTCYPEACLALDEDLMLPSNTAATSHQRPAPPLSP